MGCKSVVVKGGHHIGNAVDVLFDGRNFYHFETARIDTKNTHGTGCTFSSAIASQLAKGKSVPDAVKAAKTYVTMAIERLWYSSGIKFNSLNRCKVKLCVRSICSSY